MRRAGGASGVGRRRAIVGAFPPYADGVAGLPALRRHKLSTISSPATRSRRHVIRHASQCAAGFAPCCRSLGDPEKCRLELCASGTASSGTNCVRFPRASPHGWLHMVMDPTLALLFVIRALTDARMTDSGGPQTAPGASATRRPQIEHDVAIAAYPDGRGWRRALERLASSRSRGDPEHNRSSSAAVLADIREWS